MQQPPLATLLGLAAQVADVDAKRVRCRTEVIPPHVLEDGRAGQDLAGVLHEQLEQQELGLRQIDPALVAVDLVGDRVEHHVGEAEDLGVGAVVARTSQQRTDPGLQFAQRERLDQVVVGADIEPLNAIVDRIPSGQHQDRRPVAAARSRRHTSSPSIPGIITSRITRPHVARRRRRRARCGPGQAEFESA